MLSEHRSSPYHSDMTIFVQRVAELVRILLSFGSWHPFLRGRPRRPERRVGGGSNKFASRRSRVTKQTCCRTEAINSSAAKLESATITIVRFASQRLVCRMAWRAQSVSFLWRRACSVLQRCEGAKTAEEQKRAAEHNRATFGCLPVRGALFINLLFPLVRALLF